MEHEHAAGHRAGAVADRRGRALDVELVAVLADQQHRAHRLDRADAAHGDRERVLERLAGLLVEGAEDLVDGAAKAVLEPPAGQLLRHRVQVLDAAVRVAGDHAVADRLQGDLRAFLLAEQRLLVQLALGDVELDADQAAQPALVVDAGAGAADDPAPLPVRVLEPVHALEHRRLAGDVVAHRGRHAREVLRVHHAVPVRRGDHVALGESEHALPAWREPGAVALRVVVPQAVVRAGQRHFLALLHVGEPVRERDLLEPAGEARADELEQQVQVHVPAVAWRRRNEGEEAANRALHGEGDQEQRADVEPATGARRRSPAQRAR